MSLLHDVGHVTRSLARQPSVSVVAVVTVATLVLVATLMASVVPARRAARLDPLIALKRD